MLKTRVSVNIFLKLHYNLVTGKNNDNNDLVYQTLSGAGALSLSEKILTKLNYEEIYISSFT